MSHVGIIVTCGHTFHTQSPLSHVVTLVTCDHTCHICGHHCHKWSHAVTIIRHGHNWHTWSQLSHLVTLVTHGQTSHMVTIVTRGHNCHTWSHFSHVVTHVKCCHTYLSHCLYWEINVSIAFQKVHSLSPDETQPTYRPAWPQVKIKVKVDFK